MSIMNQLTYTINEARLFDEMVKVYAAKQPVTAWFEDPFKMVTLTVGEVDKWKETINMSVIVRTVNRHTFDITEETAAMDVPIASLRWFDIGKTYVQDLSDYTTQADIPAKALVGLLGA